MSRDSLTVLITPGPSSAAWGSAIVAAAQRHGWPTSYIGPEGPPEDENGVFFAQHHTALALSAGHRVVIADTTAVGADDPWVPAAREDLVLRAHSLVEADAAVRQGALALNASRYQLTLPELGLIERAEGQPYRIHPLAAASPLALFDNLPVVAGAEAVWAAHWFEYANGDPAADGSAWMDLTGRMRALVYGPYLRLPSGRWRVDVRVSVDPERAHVPLLFEWGDGLNFSRVMTEIRHPGTYGVSLDRIWTGADTAQLRIWNAHPLFQGRLIFDECRVVRVADDDPTPPTPTDRIVTAALV